MNPFIRRIARRIEPAIRGLVRLYVNRTLEIESSGGRYGLNERAVEYGFALRQISQIKARTILDVGTGRSSWPHLLANCGFAVTAIDNIRDYWTSEFWNRHWKVVDDDILHSKLTETFDIVTCLSVLEHIADYEKAMTGIFERLNAGGHLILTVPFNKTTYHPNVYKDPKVRIEHQYICQVYSDEQIRRWLAMNNATLIHEELFQVFTGPLWKMGERVHPVRPAQAGSLHHLGCFVIRKAS